MDATEVRTSLWETISERPSTGTPLDGDFATDVCIVGAGIAGMSTAYELARAGVRVAVLERRTVGAGETGQTTAHLASAQDDGFARLDKLHGEDGARIAWQSHAGAIDRIEEIVREEEIDCDFQRLDGYTFAAPETSRTTLEEEYEAAARASGGAVEWLERPPISTLGDGPCIRFPRQARFEPLRYLGGLAEAVARHGGKVYTGADVEGVDRGSTVTVRTAAGHTVRAGSAVIATNTPVHLTVAMHTKQAPYRTFAIALPVRPGQVKDALYWDTAGPYHYARLASDGPERQWLIVGGEDHKTGQADDAHRRYDALEAWTRERFGLDTDVSHRWSGQVYEPVDGLGFIGREPGGTNNVLLATGDSGQGMTHGVIAGILLGDLIRGRDNAWADLYAPGRITPSAAASFVKENLNVARQYADWILPGDTKSRESIGMGDGAVLRSGGKPVAVYRDADGALHECSAVCPHLGCIVRWNSDARSWDCPCHGSRFTPDGEVLTGPAMKPLSSAD